MSRSFPRNLPIGEWHPQVQQQPQLCGQSEENNALPLKKFLVCEHCGEPFTGYIAKKKNGKVRNNPLPYYNCRGRECKSNVNANSLGEKFLRELSQFTIKDEFVPLITQELEATMIQMNSEKFKEAEVMEKRLKEINGKLTRLKERFVLHEEITKPTTRNSAKNSGPRSWRF
jgi:site-specific DNA recombinase